MSQTGPKFGGTGPQGGGGKREHPSPVHLRKRSEAVEANAYDPDAGLKYQSAVQLAGGHGAQDLLPQHLETSEE